MLEAALVYLDMGWCVYPAHHVSSSGLCTCGRLDCTGPGKHPIGSWSEYKNRFPTKTEVELWFSSMECNVGMVTGRISGIVVVDVDGSKGLKTASTLGLKPTLTARTGGGGRHYFYKCDQIIPSRVKVLEGIDLRGEGGYVVLAPSIHYSGKRYSWEVVRPLATFDPKPFEVKGQNVTERSSNSFEWVEDIWKGVSTGSRNATAAKLVGRYLNLGLNLKEVWILMSTWNSLNKPPLPDWELKQVCRYVTNKHKAEDSQIKIQTLSQIRDLLKGGSRE